MVKKINRVAIIVITILLGELINAYALTLFLPYKSNVHPYKSVAITMLLAVCIFYPAFSFINKYLKDFSGKFMKKSSSIIGSQLLGKIIGFMLALLLIFLALAQILYNKNGISDFFIWMARVVHT